MCLYFIVKVQVEPEELLPKLPRPKDLQPFPTTQAIVYEGHKSYVRSISTDQSGEWFVSGVYIFSKGSGMFVSDSETKSWFSSCCNDNYKSLGQSGIPWILQANRLSDYQDIYVWKLPKGFNNTAVYLGTWVW